MDFNSFKVGEKVRLLNNYINQFLCETVGVSLENMKGTVELIDFTEDLSEKCIMIGEEVIIMKYFPCWETEE